MKTSNIRHECFLFANKMMELSDQKLMITFDVFDPEEQAKDLQGRGEEYNEYSMTHTAYRDDDKK